MGWLRLDDKFIDHPKIAQLTDLELRSWVAVLCWAAAHRTKGDITIIEEDALRKTDRKRTDIGRRVTPRMLKKWDKLRLIERAGNGTLNIHDFSQYNPTDPTAASRMQRYRARNTARNDTVTSPRVPAGAARPQEQPQTQEPPQEQKTPSQVQSVARPPAGPGPDEDTNIDLTHYWEERQRALTETEAALEQLNFEPPQQEQQP